MDIKYAYYNTSKGYRVLGGTAVHFLKADGSLDGTEYIDKTSFQDITGTKRFYTSGGNNYDNNTLHIASSDGSDPAITFNKIGTIAGQLKMNVAGYHFLNPGLGYYPVNAAGYVKLGSDDSYLLTGGGGHVPVSNFAGNNYSTYQDNREILPNEIGPQKFVYGFTSWDNNNVYPWADFIHFGGYQDSSGGNQNLIVFNRNGYGLRQYQADWQDSSPYTNHVDYWHTGNFTQANINSWNNMISDYVTLSTPQTIESHKTFNGATDNSYSGAAIMVNGNHTLGAYPTISFHQPGNYAATLSYRGSGSGFHFKNINDTGYDYVNAAGYVKPGSDDSYVLTGGGGHKKISDFVLSGQLGNYHKIDSTGNIGNGSSGRGNTSWFDYSWAGVSGMAGSVINFSGLGGNYSTELFSDYQTGNNIGIRTHNGDSANTWNSPKWLWHSGNFDPSKYVSLTGTNNFSGLISNSDFNYMFGQDANYKAQIRLFENNNPNYPATFRLIGNVEEGFFTSIGNNYWETAFGVQGNNITLIYNDLNNASSSKEIDFGTDGLIGADYYQPVSDLNYIQKKYVTDNFISSLGLSLSLANYYTKSETYNKAEVDAKLSAVYRPKGSVANFASLPTTGNTEGNVWNLLDTGANYVWVLNLNNTGTSGWDKLSETVDLTNYVTLNTEQLISARKVFTGATGNRYDQSALETRGNFISGIYPSIGFHQPGSYAGTISLRNSNQFSFRNTDDSDYNYLLSKGYIKSGSDDGRFLTGGGGDYDSRYKEDAWFHSSRNFPDGTLITTDVDYSLTNGDQFLLEMKGNMYAGGNPLIAKIQGYIYYDSIISQSGYSTLWNWNYIIALNLNGKLCFWFPYLSYWQGFDVKVTVGYGGLDQGRNRVVRVDNNADPGGTKRVEIYLEHLLTKEQLLSSSAFATATDLTQYLTQRGSWQQALAAKTDTPISITDHSDNPATTGFQSQYGTSFHFKGPNTWYNRLDFPVSAEKLFLYQGINTTAMSLRGYIDLIPAGATNWTSTNFNPSNYVTTNTPQSISALKTFDAGIRSTRYGWLGGTTTPIGKVTTESAFYNLGGNYGYGISTNQGGGLDIMANQVNQPIRFWAGNDNDNPFYVARFHKDTSSFYTHVSIENGYQLRLKGAGDIAHYIGHFSDDTDGFGVSSGFAVKNYSTFENLLKVTIAGFGEFKQNVRAGGFLKTGSSNNFVLLGYGDHKPLSDFWTSANFNPSTKVNSFENAYAVGFSSGLSTGAPYIYHATDGYIFLATQSWVSSIFANQIQLNKEFTINTGYGLGIYDRSSGESGLIDNQQKLFIAGRFGDYYKYGSDIQGLEGINYHFGKKNIGIGGDIDSNKLRVEGCVKATENFKSRDEEADTMFIPDGQLATLRDEIINEKYAIRLDPHEYEIDAYSTLDVDDRNRLIHIVGEQVEMRVNFNKIYPKQQIVIYNFDQKKNVLEVQIYGKTIYYTEPGCFLRLYVTSSLRVIAERQHPCDFVW